jgi:hypothetical protein
VFWHLKSSFEFSEVVEDSKFRLLGVWISFSHLPQSEVAIARVPTLEISGLLLRSPKTKCHLDVGLMERHRIYYKGEVVASPKSEPWWILWVQVCSWLVLAPKVFKLCTNQLVVWFCVDSCEWLMLIILHSSIPELQHAPLPLKMLRAKEHALTFCYSVVSLQTHIWVYQGAWERVTNKWCP